MRTIIIFITLFLCLHANAEECFRLKASKEEISHIQVGRLFTKSDTIMSLSKGAISGLSISGSFEKKSDDYLIRIILMDKSGHEHLVMESYDMLNSDFKVTMDNYCEETAFLEDVEPDYIKVIVNDATLIINNIGFTTTSQRDSNLAIEWAAQKAEVKREQRNSIIKRINTYNATHGRPWIAGETSLSDKSYSDKKRLLGFSDDINIGGYEYYSDGIFLVGNVSGNFTTRNGMHSPFVSKFDWRTRHGKNWVTPVKNQHDSNYCFAFASVACTESAYMLYYNDTTTIRLSDQEAACCSHYDDSVFFYGGYVDSVLMYIQNHGICDEESYPYVNYGFQPCNSGSIVYDENVRIAGYQPLNDDTKDDSIKSRLIKYGPLVSGYWWHKQETTIRADGHSMLLVGYDTISAGDIIRIHRRFGLDSPSEAMNNLIGRTYWIFKNSRGGNNDAYLGGYQHIFFMDTTGYAHNCFMNKVYNIDYPVFSNKKTNNDIICEDADGDGYYFWGIGDKPAHCPSWVPNTPDGDDSDINYGPLDDYGNLAALPAGMTIRDSVTNSFNFITPYHFGIVNGGVLTITQTTTLTGNGRIRVCEGGTLIVDGGTLQNADITMVPGCTVILRNNGKINMATGKEFNAPVGAIVNIESGEIN